MKENKLKSLLSGAVFPFAITFSSAAIFYNFSNNINIRFNPLDDSLLASDNQKSISSSGEIENLIQGKQSFMNKQLEQVSGQHNNIETLSCGYKKAPEGNNKGIPVESLLIL